MNLRLCAGGRVELCEVGVDRDDEMGMLMSWTP
jgi:hypothetical protein